MPGVLTKFLDKLTGINDERNYKEESYNHDEYITLDINEQQMKQLEEVKQTGQLIVKVHKLKSDTEYQSVLDLVRNNNIVILDIAHLKNSDFTGLKMFSNKLKQKCDEMKWGIGALSNDLLMVTPSSVRFEKKKVEEN